ncbi:MAG: NUDIX hydrolase [Micrococcales bacterium]|nr:NUDIX hydrolase [Micrococcales bacterium]MCL2668159.1 NUDIX hydrolase [Micrococcales bacterium]
MSPPLSDQPGEHPVVSHDVVYTGRVFDMVCDQVDLGSATVVREYLGHPGAVVVIAMDDDERVLLLSQYRHPVRRVLWEPVAGLLDVDGEPELDAAVRELAEEADLVAASWWRLANIYATPGGSSEHMAIFLARDLSPTPESFARTDEEATMVPVWIHLDDAVAGVLAGRLRSPSTAVGVLAAAAARAQAWTTLQPV